MNTKRLIPDSFTCANLLCGSVATLMATQNAFVWAFVLILLGAFFDFFDGMTARALGVGNKMGIELDSLADDITFGLAPAMTLCCYLRPLIGWWSLIVLLMAAFSALRLGKFNLDERQTSSFIGLATPANAIFWTSLCCMPYQMMTAVWMPWLLVALSLLSCYLLLAEIPFFSLKFHNLTWNDNSDKYIFLIGALVLVIFCVLEAIRYGHIEFAIAAGAAIILWYVTLNLLFALLSHRC
ncbi:MAG: CDP-alcohol phosphatidyltransferase family protein [Paludibacteraceae bacterium]|nr:CDP-alcohol phosphatidyltransferase family protein [Paludibacteraceae bacterium]